MSNSILLPCGARKDRGSKRFFRGWLCLPWLAVADLEAQGFCELKKLLSSTMALKLA